MVSQNFTFNLDYEKKNQWEELLFASDIKVGVVEAAD